jgi:hypothetical protein
MRLFPSMVDSSSPCVGLAQISNKLKICVRLMNSADDAARRRSSPVQAVPATPEDALRLVMSDAHCALHPWSS